MRLYDPLSAVLARTRVKYGPRKLDVAKVPGTLSHSFTACLAFEVPVDGAHPRIHQTSNLWFMGGLIHNFRMFNFGNRVSFLWIRIIVEHHHLRVKIFDRTHNLFRRKDPKLNLLHFAHGRCGIRELMSQHLDY